MARSGIAMVLGDVCSHCIFRRSQSCQTGPKTSGVPSILSRGCHHLSTNSHNTEMFDDVQIPHNKYTDVPVKYTHQSLNILRSFVLVPVK